MKSRELQSLGIPLESSHPSSSIATSQSLHTLRSATRTREQAPLPSSIATCVLQCTDLRLLIQSFTIYEESSDGEGASALHGGWKLAHLCRLNFQHRLSLIGDLRNWDVLEMDRYYQKRVRYIIRYKHAAPCAKFKEQQKFLCDVPQIVVQLHRWLQLHQEKMKEANDREFYHILESLLSSTTVLLETIDGRKDTLAEAKKHSQSVGILYALRNVINANILKRTRDRLKTKFENLHGTAVQWLGGIIENDEVSFFNAAV